MNFKPAEKTLWGTKQNLYYATNVCIDRLFIVKGGYCSRHKHSVKCNRFWVESGVLKLIVEYGKEIKEHLLGPTSPEQGLDIPPRRIHRFEALSECIVIEVSSAACIDNDIYRYDTGGVKQ